MSDFKLSSLDVLAEAALFYSTNQENDAQSINCSAATVPKKRKHYLLDRYEAEQNGGLNGAASFVHGRLMSNSSGYSSSTTSESERKSSSDGYQTSSPEPYESCSGSTSPTSSDHSPTASLTASLTASKPRKTPETTSVNSSVSSAAGSTAGSTAKKSQLSRSRKASSTASTPTDGVQRDYLNEFVKKVSITPKVDNSKAGADDVFDDNVKIEVKTPKLTYTLRAMRTRKPSTKTPDHLKDQDYFEKRERNNLAARKSRNNKNAAIRTSALKLNQLEQERKELDWELGKEIMIMKFLQEKMETDPALKERVMNLVDENQLTYFSKVLQLKETDLGL